MGGTALIGGGASLTGAGSNMGGGTGKIGGGFGGKYLLGRALRMRTVETVRQ